MKIDKAHTIIMACIILMAIVGFLIAAGCGYYYAKGQHECNKPEPTFDDLLDAIEWVESKGDADAIGDNGRAVGAYQIHSCYIEDVGWGYNGGERYDDEDRFDRDKSRIITRRYLSHYGTYRRLNRYPTLDDFARIHNGGPDGWKKESTKAYCLKVKASLKSHTPIGVPLK